MDDLIGLLEQRDERVGLHHAARRVVPSQERLDAEHATVFEVEDRLIHEEELAALDRGPEIELEREAVFDRGLHLTLERDVPIAAGGLRLVERDVGVAQQIGRRDVAPERDADARGDPEAATGGVVDLERLAQHLEQPLGDELRAPGRRSALDEHDELVAAEAGDRVGFSQGRREPRRDRLQQPVAGFVAERVVDLLETVEIDEQRGALGARPAGPSEHLLDPVEDERAVGQSGERVVQRLVTDALEQAGVADRDRGLAGEAAQPVRDLGIVAETLGPLGDVADDETDGVAVDHDRDRRHCRGAQFRHQLRQRAAIGGARPIPDVDGDVRAPHLRDRHFHRTQPHVGRCFEAVGGHDATGCRLRFEQDDGGAVATDDGRHRACDVYRHLVGRSDFGQGVRQLEEGTRGLGLAARVFERGGRVERGRDQARVDLQHDSFLREEPPVGVDRRQAAVATAVRLHVDDQMVLVVVVHVGEELDREALGLGVCDSGRVHELVGRGQRFQREHEHRCRDRAGGRHDDARENVLEIVVGDEIADRLLQPLEARGQNLVACLEVLGLGRRIVGEPADAVLARRGAVARARFLGHFRAHTEQSRDVRVETGCPRAVLAVRSEAVEEPLAHDPLGGSDLAPFEGEHRSESRAARLGHHLEQRLGRTERLQHRSHLGHRGVGQATARRAREGRGSTVRGGRFEQPAELVVGAPRREIEELVDAASFLGFGQDARHGARGRLVAQIAHQHPGVHAREMKPGRKIGIPHSKSVDTRSRALEHLRRSGTALAAPARELTRCRAMAAGAIRSSAKARHGRCECCVSAKAQGRT